MNKNELTLTKFMIKQTYNIRCQESNDGLQLLD